MPKPAATLKSPRKAARKTPAFVQALALREDSRFTLTLPLPVVPETNQREFWRKRAARRKAQREQFAQEWQLAFGAAVPRLPCIVRFTRLGGWPLDSDDNLPGAFKAVRDELARIIGTDDRSPLYTWRYGQEPGGPVGIRVEIQEGARLKTVETVVVEPAGGENPSKISL